MSTFQSADPERIPSLEGSFARVLGEPTTVAPFFRVLNAQAPESLTEFISSRIGAHIIRMTLENEDFNLHTKLHSAGIPVLESLSSAHERALLVPKGAVVISHSLAMVARNSDEYSELFTALGRCLAKIEHAELGLPQTDTPLHNFIYSENANVRTGVDVHLVPPYNLNDSVSKEDVLFAIDYELACSQQFNEKTAEFLRSKTLEGWNSVS
jgi:hypothetical protein